MVGPGVLKLLRKSVIMPVSPFVLLVSLHTVCAIRKLVNMRLAHDAQNLRKWMGTGSAAQRQDRMGAEDNLWGLGHWGWSLRPALPLFDPPPIIAALHSLDPLCLALTVTRRRVGCRGTHLCCSLSMQAY